MLPLVAAAVVAAGTGWALAATVATSLSDSALPFPVGRISPPPVPDW